MMGSYLALLLTLLSLNSLASAQFPQTYGITTDVTTLRSPADSKIIISFKTPPVGTCTTVFSAQKQYTGYVSIPPFTLTPIQQNYTINTFFWFVEAREKPNSSPLTIYMNGGPGSSSMVGLFLETGPCEVVEIAKDRLGTRARDWGWDRSSNMLYVDQPNQVGFSYDVATNGSLNLLSQDLKQPPVDRPADQPPLTFLDGTFSSNDGNKTANTTEIAALAIWHMLQGFLGVFPQYHPSNIGNETQPSAVGINLFAESYGGKYGPAFALKWEEQNALRKNTTLRSSNKTLDIHLKSLGVIQGCVDDLVQGSWYPRFANNNTYGIKALSLADQQAAASNYFSVGGCQQLTQECRKAANVSDENSEGDVNAVNQACRNAQDACQRQVIGPFRSSGRNPYDITQKENDPFPPSTYMEYLNTADVQAAIGVPVNYTQSTNPVPSAFQATGDMERAEPIPQMAYLLSLGLRIGLIYGDRDYLCNWVGGEQVSLSLASQLPAYAPFSTAGYADIVVNSSYVGGAVRQYGNLSFSRIYDAGHLVPAYQPETAFTVFTRLIMGDDISFGQKVDLSNHKSSGPSNSSHRNKAPKQEEAKCWIRDLQAKCTDDQINRVRLGQGVVINGVWYASEEDWKAPPSSISSQAGYPGFVPSSSMPAGAAATSKGGSAPSSTSTIPTGVFTATAVPTTTKSVAASLGVWDISYAWLAVAGALLHCVVVL